MLKRKLSGLATALAAACCLIVHPIRAATQTHNASDDFSSSANPTPTGWQYSEAMSNGGGVVGAYSADSWNTGDFGPGQPGWLGGIPGGHAGWAKRIANFPHDPAVRGDDYDWPVGALLTHGPTSIAWKAPVDDPNHYATLSGGAWNVRHLGRSGTWRIYKNNTVLTEGTVNDASGSSAAPMSFGTGSGGADALRQVRYEAGDTFRFETTEGDFLASNFIVTTSNEAPDPEITTQPQGQTAAAGSNISLSVVATGTSPVTYQWKRNGENVSNGTGATLNLSSIQQDQAGDYTVLVTSANGSRLSSIARIGVDQVSTSNTHDLSADFSLNSNPTLSGWQYSVSVDSGGGVVGPVTQNFNQGDFGADQPGWEGTAPGAHAGWGKRVDNCPNSSPACNLPYDAPAGTVFTHGPTSALWKAPANDPNRYATLTGGLWNLRPFNRSGTWRLFKNSTPLSQGIINDAGGNSSAPISLATGSGGEEALKLVPYVPGDSFRIEVDNNDFVGVQFTVTTSNVGPDPDIATQPVGALISEGGNITLSVAAVGTQPFTYQWRLNGQDIANATSATLSLNGATADQTGAYSVVVTNSKGSKSSQSATVVVDAVGAATPGLHDLARDFTFKGNPTARGWTYAEALSGGGGPVGALVNDWNAATFGPGQPGYVGVKAGEFGGWAERVNNGALDALDAPVGTIITHGPTSVKYTVQADESFKFANITASLWSVEKNNRGQGWKLWKNDNVLLGAGVVSGGTSDAPLPLASDNLQGIPISPGDTFRLEILPTSGPGGQTHGPYGDFVGVNLTINTTNEGPDPAIASNPLSQVVLEGTDVTLNVTATGTGPFTYQWQLEGADVQGQTGASLHLPAIGLTQGGNYTVIVTNSKGSRASIPALVTVTPKPPEVSGAVYDLGGDFSLASNPTPKGWEYDNSLAIGGEKVGGAVANWNQPDYGPGQPGWEGNTAGAHAGWARRVSKAPSGAPGDNYDWPVGVVLTHGPTSVKWTAPADLRPGSVADIVGGVWNARHLNRSSQWHLYHNDTEIITEGVVDDNAGSSASPISFSTGSGGPGALKNIPLNPGDSFRLDIAGLPQGGAYDFVASNFSIIVREEHDASADFDAAANPSPSGWQYSESVANGGGPVGPYSPNWNQPDFGAGQPGWLGAIPGAHAGWAKRVDNGNATPSFDDPVGTIMTHGPTSIRWKASPSDPGGLATITGGVWNLRHLGRAGTWNIYKNGTALTSGVLNDASGTSAAPFAFSRGSAGDVLRGIPYHAGDEFRLEILQNDFTGVKFDIGTYASGIVDPEITTQPQSISVVSGADATLSVAATGSTPLTYRWQLNEQDINGQTGSSLNLSNIQGGGNYRVIVSSPAGSVTSSVATVSVITVAGNARTQDAGAAGVVALEAEHYNQKVSGSGVDWTLVTDPPGFSGAGAMAALPNTGINLQSDTSASPRLDYKVRFSRAGTYRVWLRALGDSAPGASANDSVNVGLDNALNTGARITGFPQDAGYVWSGVNIDAGQPTISVGSPGLHVVNVWMREDGFILDKILLTLESGTTPAGAGPAESVEETTEQPILSIARSGANIVINWTNGGTLQMSDQVNSGYADVATTGGHYETPVGTSGAKYFRVR